MKTYGNIHWKVETVTYDIRYGKTTVKTETDEVRTELNKEGKSDLRLINFKNISAA